MKGKFDVYIVQIGSEFRVRPAVWAAARGSQFLIKNTTDRVVTVTFTNTNVLDDPANPTNVLQAADPKGNRKDDQWSLKLSTKCDGGCYTYKVDVQTTTTVSAVGESEPVMIIDP